MKKKLFRMILTAENKAIKKICVRDDMKNITPSLTAFTFFID